MTRLSRTNAAGEVPFFWNHLRLHSPKQQPRYPPWSAPPPPPYSVPLRLLPILATAGLTEVRSTDDLQSFPCFCSLDLEHTGCLCNSRFGRTCAFDRLFRTRVLPTRPDDLARLRIPEPGLVLHITQAPLAGVLFSCIENALAAQFGCSPQFRLLNLS